MKSIVTAVTIVFVILCFGAISGATNLQEGFMRYKWGEDISKYRGLIELRAKEEVTYYSNPGESYSFEDITINDVVFGFYKEKFFAVYIGVDTLEIYDDINRYLKKKYGFPGTKVSSKEYLTTYKWKYKDVTIKLKTDEIKGKMKLAFYNDQFSQGLYKITIDDLDETSYRFFPIDKNKKPEMIPFLEF